jgi:hypothetical protein
MRGFLVQVEPEFLRRGLTPRVERRSRRRLAVALASLAAVVLFAALATSAGAFNYDQGYKVLVSTTGNHSELTDHLDITATQGQSPTVVMSLRLPSLLAGDRLDIGSELEVTTDCLNSGGHCGRYADGSVGNPYTYNPFVDTQLVLTSGASRTVGTPISALSERQCRQSPRDYRNHHCTLVFPDAGLDVSASGLACPLSACYVNLVASAWNADAQNGDKLIVGEDQPDGSTVQDKGRINAVRLRPNARATAPVQTLSTSDPVADLLPVGNGVIDRSVVFSQRLDNLKTNEQLAVNANMDTNIDCCTAAGSALPYRVLIQSKLILASSPTDTTISSAAIDGTTQQGEIAEANGFNCTHFDKTVSLSPWDSPCQTQKVGVSKMLDNTGTLYVNLVVGTEAIGGTPDPTDRVQVTGGNLNVVRYPASRKG